MLSDHWLDHCLASAMRSGLRSSRVYSCLHPLTLESPTSDIDVYQNASIRDHGSLLFSPTNFLLARRHSCTSRGPRWPLLGRRGLSDYLRPRRNLTSASAMPSHSNCRGMLQRRGGPKHHQVSSSRHSCGQ